MAAMQTYMVTNCPGLHTFESSEQTNKGNQAMSKNLDIGWANSIIASAKRLNRSANGNPRLELVLATEEGMIKVRTPSDVGWVYRLPCASDLTEMHACAEWHKTPTGRYVLDYLEV